MDLRTRTALVSRVSAVLGDITVPERLSDLPLSQQMALQNADPEAAMVLSGEPLPASLELQITSGTWDSEYSGQSLEQQREAAKRAFLEESTSKINAALASAVERRQQRDLATEQQARQNSLNHQQAQLKAARGRAY